MLVSVTSVLLLSTALNESSMIVTSSSELKVWKKNELASPRPVLEPPSLRSAGPLSSASKCCVVWLI
jgi:hypothetical protein